jgi:hypothetical protein
MVTTGKRMGKLDRNAQEVEETREEKLAASVRIGGKSITCPKCDQSLTLDFLDVVNRQYVRHSPNFGCPNCKGIFSMDTGLCTGKIVTENGREVAKVDTGTHYFGQVHFANVSEGGWGKVVKKNFAELLSTPSAKVLLTTSSPRPQPYLSTFTSMTLQ